MMGNSTMDMSMMDMSMVMTFGSFSDYRVQILFDGWDVTEKWQFALSWFAVVILTVVYHFSKHGLLVLEKYMATIANKRLSFDSGYGSVQKGEQNDSSHTLNASLVPNKKNGKELVPLIYYIAHALYTGFNYGYSLLLMLIAMTYNPSLFVALMIGWAIGDFIFYCRMPENTHKLEDSHDCG